jgi:hypothetical protein
VVQVAGYTFNEGSGTTAAEVSGGASISGIPGWAAGLHSNALLLNLVNGPTLSPFSTNTAFTIMFDVYVLGDGGSGYNIFISNTSGVGNVQIDANGNLEWYHDSGTSPALGTVSDLTWTNLAVTADGTNRKAYVASSLVGSWANSSLSSTGQVKIGGDLAGGYTANFRMDNLRFFNTALTAGEISAYAGTPVTAPGLEAFLSDGVGVGDSMSALSDAPFSITINLSDNVGVSDIGSQQTLDITDITDDPVGVSDALTATLTTGSLTSTASDPVGVTDVLTATLTPATTSSIFYSDGNNWYAL